MFAAAVGLLVAPAPREGAPGRGMKHACTRRRPAGKQPAGLFASITGVAERPAVGDSILPPQWVVWNACLQVASNGDPNAFQWPRFVMLLMYPPTEETKHDGDSNAADGPFDRERAVRQVRELLGLDLGVTFHRRDQIRQLIGRQPAVGVIWRWCCQWRRGGP